MYLSFSLHFSSSAGFPDWLGLLRHSDRLLYSSLASSTGQNHGLPNPLSEDQWWTCQGWEAPPDQNPLHFDWTVTWNRVHDICVCCEQQPGESASDWHTGNKWVPPILLVSGRDHSSSVLMFFFLHNYPLWFSLFCYLMFFSLWFAHWPSGNKIHPNRRHHTLGCSLYLSEKLQDHLCRNKSVHFIFEFLVSSNVSHTSLTLGPSLLPSQVARLLGRLMSQALTPLPPSPDWIPALNTPSQSMQLADEAITPPPVSPST